MGDRASCLLVMPHKPETDAPTGIWLYSHFEGVHMPQRVAQGLHDIRARWGFPSYVARVLLTRIMGAEADQIDGFGVGLLPFAIPADAGRPALVVDLRLMRAGYVAWGDVHRGTWPRLEYDYEGFIQVGGAAWPVDAKKSRP